MLRKILPLICLTCGAQQIATQSVTPSYQLTTPTIRVDSGKTNQWLILSNGFIVVPPCEFATEAQGADGLAGTIYFSGAGQTGLDNGATYIKNLVHRASTPGGQLLISHYNIYLEEQSAGTICLGNDISIAGIIEVRYEDDNGWNLATNALGHAHPIVFSPRKRFPDGSVHPACPGIIAFHGGGPDEEVESPGVRYWGTAGRGEIAFYSMVPWADWNEKLSGGVELGRMTTNGWNLYGQVNVTNLNAGGITTNVNIMGANGSPLRLIFKSGLLTDIQQK